MMEDKPNNRVVESEEETDKWMAVRNERISRERRRNFIIASGAALILVAAVAVFFTWRARRSSEEAAHDTVVVSVKVVKAERETISAQVSALGTISPREKADVGAKISAQIKQMAILKNQFVKAGQVIAVLESKDLMAERNEAIASLHEAEANQRSVVAGTIPQNTAQDEKALRDARAKVANARAIYQRRQAIFAQGGISQKDLEAAQLDLTEAEDELRLAEENVTLRTKSLNPTDRETAAAKTAAAQQRVATLDAQLSYATVRAPISGIVTDQFQFEGEFAAAGGKLVTISDVSQVIVKAPFADTATSDVKVGDSATVVPTDQSGEQRTGQVSLVSRSSDPVNRTVEVWVTLGNEGGEWRANGAAQVTIASVTKPNVVVVPTSAVTLEATNGDEGVVMLVDANSVAHETKVKVGVHTANKMEITSGLKGGETIVVEGNYALPDGTKVEVSDEKKDESEDADSEEKKKEP